jgi:hypothetical protein
VITVPEPACDIRAQIAALLDPQHPKDAVSIPFGDVVARQLALDLVRGTEHVHTRMTRSVPC